MTIVPSGNFADLNRTFFKANDRRVPLAHATMNFVGLDLTTSDRPMTLHSPTENSLAVLNHKILEANSKVKNVKLGGHQTCLSINRLWHELCDMLRRLVGTTAPGHHDCSIQE
ncbi:uncharacterized protein TNCV_2713811 [Trichonephila clavipes]|nr:uncharacterized protein TNCV_2713811 [Trichonephila clavipes]